MVVHSDRGSQFRSKKFRNLLTGHGLVQSNVLDRKKWATRLELRLALVRWINGTYNRRRRQKALGKLTPLEYEITYQSTAQAA
jgi:transposase InsO family protein